MISFFISWNGDHFGLLWPNTCFTFRRVRVLLLVLLNVATASACCAESIRLRNDFGTDITVWFQPEGQTTFIPRPLTLRSSETASVHLQTPGRTYVVARTTGGQEYRFGWMPLRRLAELDESIATLQLKGRTIRKCNTVWEDQPYTYNVTVHKQEQRTRTVKKMRRLPDGRTIETEEQQTYTVMVPSTEQRQGTRRVARALEQDEFQDLSAVESNGRTSQLRDHLSALRSEIISSRVGAELPNDVQRSLVDLSPENSIEAATVVNRFLGNQSLECLVTFTTKDPGAEVYYQVVDSSRPEVAAGISTVQNRPVPAAWYYVWAVRDGVPTQKHFVDIIRVQESVFVGE